MLHLQLHQLINLVLLLLLGKYVANIYMPWFDVLVVLGVTFFVEHVLIYVKVQDKIYFSYSSLSTALGIVFMMVTPHLWVVLLVITLGLLQKHLLSFEGRHFFNPSNFALLMGLLFFYNDAHIVLGQLGDNIYLVLIVVVLAGMVLYRANRWVIPVVFSLTYLLLQYVFVVSYDPVMIMEEVYYRFYSVSFIVFIVFMLTDPKTTPVTPVQQVVFAIGISIVAVFLDRYMGFRVQHLFMSLFVLSPLVGLFDKWRVTNNRQKLLIYTLSLLVFSLSVIITIENKAPYYFEMNR